MGVSINVVQITQLFAYACLSVAYLLPLSLPGNTPPPKYAHNDQFLFFWPIVVLLVVYISTNRWLASVTCLIGAGAGLICIDLMGWYAYKATPLVGLQLAQGSLAALVVGWLVLSVAIPASWKRVRAA